MRAAVKAHTMKDGRNKIAELERALDGADAVIIGAGAGLSTAAGLTYGGERFERYFADFAAKHGFRDMYAGGFHPYETLEEYWAFWSRAIWVNRYGPIPGSAYDDLLALVGGKDFFVLTTNVDHCFQRAGFPKGRLFYTQGDYGLFQCSGPCRAETFDNEEVVCQMVLAQGFSIGEGGDLLLPDGGTLRMRVPSELVPRCPHCGRPLVPNLRVDGSFVEDAGWHEASTRYANFLRSAAAEGRKALYLELGVGFNTPAIIKYPFMRAVAKNPHAVYACVNRGECFAPPEIAERSVLVDADIAEVLKVLVAKKEGRL